MSHTQERLIESHIINPQNDRLRLVACGARGDGNANHHYLISGVDYSTNPCADMEKLHPTQTAIVFQHGLIPEHGANGLTHEVLLAIVADRLRGFQSGKYACKENARALTHIEEAMHWLQRRNLPLQARCFRGDLRESGRAAGENP